MKIIPVLEINKRIDELPEMIAGIHDRVKTNSDGYVKLSESNRQDYVPYSRHQIYEDVHNSIKGKDFHEDLENLHRNVKPFIENEGQANAHDNYIYDTLKSGGIPSGKTALHIVSVATMPGLDPYNSDYLTKKWIPLLDKYAKVDRPKITNLDAATYSKGEIQKIPQGLQPTNARVLHHGESNTSFEYHPEEGYRYLGKTSLAPTLTSKAFEDNVSHRGTAYALHNTYSTTNDPNETITDYTEDSVRFNRYLHLKHNGRIKGPGSILGKSYGDIQDSVNDLSDVINDAPHESQNNDFRVYSGLHTEFNPEKDAKATDENGNYIFHNPAFTSTSLKRTKAHEFARGKADMDYPSNVHDLMTFTVPGGYPHGVFAKPFSEHEDEEEYLLDKGHTFLLNPNPKHYVVDGKVYREWSAKLHPKSATDKPYEEQSNAEKINTSYLDNVNPEHIEKMSRDEDADVVAAAARNGKLSEDRIKALTLHNSPKVRKALMLNPKLPNHIIDDKINKFDLSSVRSLANRPNLTDDQKSKIIQLGFTDSEKFKDNIIHRSMAHRRDLTDEHVRQLQKSQDTATHVNLAGNPNINPDILHEYAMTGSTPVRFSLAENHAIHPKTLELLNNDKDFTVKYNAEKNPLNHRGFDIN